MSNKETGHRDDVKWHRYRMIGGIGPDCRGFSVGPFVKCIILKQKDKGIREHLLKYIDG